MDLYNFYMKSLSESLQESINGNVDEGLIKNIIIGDLSFWALYAIIAIAGWAVVGAVNVSSKVYYKTKNSRWLQAMVNWMVKMGNSFMQWLDHKGLSPQVLKVVHSKPFEDYMKSHPSKWDIAEVAEICQRVLNDNADQSAIEGVYKEFKRKNPNVSDVEFA